MAGRACTAGPLAGIRIIDFTANMSGPFATMILGDQGADIVKVEPTTGDIIRFIGMRGPHAHDVTTYFANLNRSKRSVTIDLTDERSRAAVDVLLDSADVVVHNFRPGLDVKFGLDAQTVRRGRPKLIYAAITGYGHTGPFGGQPAYDHVIQAIAGFAAVQGTDADEPGMVRQGVVDKITGLSVAQAVTAALLQRATTGQGQELEITMLGVATAFLWPDVMINHTIVDGDTPERPISRTFRLTKTRDGHLAFVLMTASRMKRLAVGLGVDNAQDLPDGGPVRTGGWVLRQAAEQFSTMPTAEAVDMLLSWGIPAAPVVGLDELASHPQIAAGGHVDAFDDPALGRIQQANPAVCFAGERAGTLRPAPRLGQHSVEVLRELGLPADAVEELMAAGVVSDVAVSS